MSEVYDDPVLAEAQSVLQADVPDEGFVEPPDSAQPNDGHAPSQIDAILFELRSATSDLSEIVSKLASLQEANHFRYASKAARNALMLGMLEHIDHVQAVAKKAFRGLKKVKRERLPEDVSDELLEALSPLCPKGSTGEIAPSLPEASVAASPAADE